MDKEEAATEAATRAFDEFALLCKALREIAETIGKPLAAQIVADVEEQKRHARR